MCYRQCVTFSVLLRVCYGAGDSHITLVGVDAVEQGFRCHPLDWQAALGDKQRHVRRLWTSTAQNFCTGASLHILRVLQKGFAASRDQQYEQLQTAGLLKDGEDVELHTNHVDSKDSLGR